ncbi:hypothetical protein C1Y63_02325 [Corynebacterium sp. 13CS0277]|uniref:type II secretion system F family protein n=1 Tax=Corynebacterium sp. 13CS0277 TaxID=2071994 RepID=UPI000D02736D|nr:type II secretion system F family protein [Corynebacterium sp. 13CS0277]PRQ12168.1 hypothetical protein C1Y63_02325 [Corynebacterium sp. 13CS0277]
MTTAPTALLLLAGALLATLPPPSGRLQPAPARARRTRRWAGGEASAHDIAADIELFAACMGSGLTAAAAADIVASTATAPRAWRTTASLLALGAAPDIAWGPMLTQPKLGDLAHLAIAAHTHGTPMTEGLTRLATTIRDTATTDAAARAEKAGVLIALPLAAFFLPAFMIVGLAPIVISIGSTMLPGH